MKNYLSFKGKSYHSITDTGRISVPSKFRDILKTKYGDETLIIVTYGKYLAAYPLEEWHKVEEFLEKEKAKDPQIAKFVRHVYSTAEDCVIDKQGRILIPNHLRDKTGLKSECVIIGVKSKMEIWPKERWESEFEQEDLGEFFGKLSAEFPEIDF